MQTRLILLFAISFQTIHYSFELSSVRPSNSNTIYSKSYESIDEYPESNVEHEFFNVKNDHKSMALIGNVFSKLMDGFTPFSYDNPKCTEDGKLYKEHLIEQNLWAVLMYDSSAKYPGGLLSGITYEMGHYDQCLRAHSKELNIYSAYVLPNIQFRISEASDCNTSEVRSKEISAWKNLKVIEKSKYPKNNNINWALCIPNSCDIQDVQTSITELLTPAFQRYNITINVFVNPALYTSKPTYDQEHKDGYLVAFYIFSILIIALNVVGTLYETNIVGQEYVNNCSILKNILVSFSTRTSIKKVFQKPKHNDLAVTNGLKTIISIMFIVIHRILFNTDVHATDNPYFFEKIISSPWTAWLNIAVFVEIFFVISGFLMYISVTNHLNKKGKLNFIYLLSYRIARLLPAIILVFLLFLCVLPHIADGPLWKLYATMEAENCRKNWWRKLLFIDNYLQVPNNCMPVSWSVNCDIHFYAIGVLITYALWKWQNIGLWIFGLVFAASIYTPAKTIYINRLTAVLTYNNVINYRSNPYLSLVYVKSHQKFTTYLIGIAGAYIYTKLKLGDVKISSRNKTYGCIISLVLFFLSLLSTIYFHLPGIEYNPWHHILYFTLQRTVVATCASYFIVVNAISGFGYVSKFLESYFFSVMGNFTFSLYLCHYLFQAQSLYSNRTLMELNVPILVRNATSDVLLALFGTSLIVLLFETPCHTIRYKLDAHFQNVKNQTISDSHVNEEKKKTK